MGLFGRKGKKGADAPELPDIPADAPWSSFADAAGRQWRSGDLRGAVVLWKQSADRWDGKDEGFLRVYRGIPRCFSEKVVSDISKGVLHPCHQLAELESYMSLKFPDVTASVCRESFDSVSSKLDRMDSDDHVVLLCMNCFYLQIGRMGWAADIRDVPLFCRSASALAERSEGAAGKHASEGYMGSMNVKMAVRTLALYKGFFDQLSQDTEEAVRSRPLEDIESAVAYWSSAPADRTLRLAEGLNAVGRGASAGITRSNRRSADAAISAFIEEYFGKGSSR